MASEEVNDSNPIFKRCASHPKSVHMFFGRYRIHRAQGLAVKTVYLAAYIYKLHTANRQPAICNVMSGVNPL